MKRMRRLLSLWICIVLMAGMGMATAERDPWDCPNCGRKGNTGNFCGSCGQPAPEAAPAATEAPGWTVIYKIYYRDEGGTLLAADTLILKDSGTMTYTILADDSLVPPEYVLTGERNALLTINNGIPEPMSITFFYRDPGTPAQATTPNIKAGDYVTFGHYEQNNDTADGPEAIEWLVLEVKEGKALLLSRYGLDAKPYNAEWTNVTWETCSLREWLNGEFVNSAFSSAEQAGIEETRVDNSAAQCYSDWSTNGGKNTRDKVYLLSYGEANQYLGVKHNSISGSGNNMKSRTSATAYAKAQGAWTGSENRTSEGLEACRWWLRSPGFYQDFAADVASDGSLIRYGVLNASVCVRPVLWVNLESGFF